METTTSWSSEGGADEEGWDWDWDWGLGLEEGWGLGLEEGWDWGLEEGAGVEGREGTYLAQRRERGLSWRPSWRDAALASLLG